MVCEHNIKTELRAIAARPLCIIEFGYVITQKVVGKKVTTSCSIASNGSDGIQTTPVKFTMIWTRD